MGEEAAGTEARTPEQAARRQERGQAAEQLEVRLGESEAQETPPGWAEERTTPARGQRSLSCQDPAAIGSRLLLGVGETELVEEGS